MTVSVWTERNVNEQREEDVVKEAEERRSVDGGINREIKSTGKEVTFIVGCRLNSVKHPASYDSYLVVCSISATVLIH